MSSAQNFKKFHGEFEKFGGRSSNASGGGKDWEVNIRSYVDS